MPLYKFHLFILTYTYVLTYLLTCLLTQLSATRIMWLVGLYELTLSSAIGNISGSPNVLQGIAGDNVIPFLAPLATGVRR